MATLEELVVKIKADASQLESELKRVSGTTKQQTDKMTSAFGVLKSQLTGLVPALSAAALVSFGKQAIDTAGHINDLADRIGFAASSLSALETPLRTNGSSLDEFAASINRMNNLVGEASKGINQEAVKAFDELGLSVRKLQDMSPEDQFYEITTAIMGLDSQAKITESGMNIFGRSFATMLPLLKDSNGNLRESVQQTKDLKEALDADTIKRIDDFGDSMEAAGIKTRNAFLEAFAAILKVVDAIPDPEKFGSGLGTSLRDAMGLPPAGVGQPNPFDDYAAKAGGAGFATEATRASGFSFDAQGNLVRAGTTSAKGDNSSLLKMTDEQKQIEAATKAYQDYLDKIEEENYLLHINEDERAGVKAVLDAETLAKKANITISEEQRQEIMATVNANEALTKSMQEAARFSQELKDKLSDGLADIVFSFDSATDSAKRFLEQIAKTVVEKKITGPLSDQLIGALDGGSGGGGILSGIGDFFGGFFADGGRPPVGKPSVIGEDGPEVWVPDSAGTVVPNSAIGGSQVSVTNVFQISTGVSQTVRAELMNLMPYIQARTTAGVAAEVEKGGRMAQVFGKKN